VIPNFVHFTDTWAEGEALDVRNTLAGMGSSVHLISPLSTKVVKLIRYPLIVGVEP
jgi:hypothetical protein